MAHHRWRFVYFNFFLTFFVFLSGGFMLHSNFQSLSRFLKMASATTAKIYTKLAMTAQAHSMRVHAFIFTVSLSLTNFAHAQGLSGFSSGWNTGLKSFIELTITTALLGGIISVMYGLFNWSKKGLGRGDDIETRQIVIPIIAGGLLSILMWVLKTVVETGGASSGDIGKNL
jgi:hypothetical protein